MPASPIHSVRGKLLLVVIVTTFTALAVAAAALMVYDLKTYEESRVSDLVTLADVLATASAPALAFNDRREAQDNLELLRVRPSILAGALYDAAGARIAIYQQDARALAELPLPATDAHYIRGDRLVLSRAIREKGERVGTLYLVAKYESAQRLVNSAAIFGGVILFSLLVAALISTWVGRTLSTPILDVTEAAHRVMERRDFSVRVSKRSDDEIGYLVDAFNAMLDEVGRRSAALEEADRMKDQFLAVLAHELRNPLSPIRNAVAILRLVQADPARVRWASEVIDRQVRLLARLLDDLLDVARITQNRIELRMQVVDVATVLETAVEGVRSTLEANQQALELDLPRAPIHLRGDPTRLAQVLGNILNNAAKYTDRGGRIRLAVARGEDSVTISVRDSGIGIAPADLPRVFDMFVQVPASMNRAAGGLGIGLALVRALVELHGGTVVARSEGIGKGSEFLVTLPTVVQAGAGSGAPEGGAPDPRARKDLRVLVADDVADSRETLAMGLQMIGYQVRTAADGPQALDAARAFRPDVAILDIGMPGLTGYEVARRIRQHDWGRETILIALTGWGQRDDLHRASAAGFDHHMTKPADSAALHRLLDGIAARRRPAAPSRAAC
jgi:signal transduction histidine kinase/ActR/RegA family two-component response regulator